MKVSKYWHKESGVTKNGEGHEFELTSWGGSLQSVEDARQRAIEKLDRWISRLSRGDELDEYEYGRGEIREELFEEIYDSNENLIGAITRNRYGSLVLNAANVLIADIDVPPSGLFQWLRSLFGGKPRDKAYHLNRLQEYSAANQDCALLVYETHSGLRVFITNADHCPTDEVSDQVLKTLGSDRLYHVLCRSQKCYRARLTPKPWRCGVPLPPRRFPRETPEEQREFDQWLARYSEESKKYTVCQLMERLGPRDMNRNAEKLVAYHDAVAVNRGSRELA